MTTTARIAVVSEAGADFAIEEREIADPGPHEVLIELVATGVCHTDLAVQAGDLPTNFPVVLGHEGAGKVIATGSHVTDIAEGDHVVLSYGSCGHCRPCQEGDPAYCADFNPLNFMNKRQGDDAPVFADGPNAAFFQQSSFATHSIAHERNVVKIEGDVDISLLGPLGCGVQTGAGSVLTALNPPAGSDIVIFGAGAVGLSAVMGAVVANCTTIMVVDIKQNRLDLATELGATHVINAEQGNPVEAVMELTGGRGASYMLETTGNAKVLEGAIYTIAMGGEGGIVGAPAMGATVNVDVNFMLFNRRLRGIIEGDSNSDIFIPRLIELYKQGKFPFDKLIKFYTLDEINQAAEDSENGSTLKPVLKLA